MQLGASELDTRIDGQKGAVGAMGVLLRSRTAKSGHAPTVRAVSARGTSVDSRNSPEADPAHQR